LNTCEWLTTLVSN